MQWGFPVGAASGGGVVSSTVGGKHSEIQPHGGKVGGVRMTSVRGHPWYRSIEGGGVWVSVPGAALMNRPMAVTAGGMSGSSWVVVAGGQKQEVKDSRRLEFIRRRGPRRTRY